LPTAFIDSTAENALAAHIFYIIGNRQKGILLDGLNRMAKE
jgi:hypothetical protein